MRRTRRSRLDSVKLDKVATNIVAYLNETSLIAPVVIQESIDSITRYKQCWGIIENLKNERNESLRDVFIEESATALILAIVRKLQLKYRNK